jgi:cell division septation protein DedD
VVAYTFSRQADAQNSVEAIAAKHPDLRPEIFSPAGNSGPYLVVLGGRMDRDQASRLKQKARLEGMPQDTYIQNYKY